MRRQPQVAILGAGIMGSSAALFLARQGARVMLFDAAPGPLEGASRWNEGKIHLGYLYNAAGTMDTVRQVLPGGLLFKSLTERLIGCSLADVTTGRDDIFLCHRDSVVGPGAMWDHFQRVTDMVRAHPDAHRYLVDASRSRAQRMSATELGQVADPATVRAGFKVPERSVATTWIADRITDALRTETGIEQRMRTKVTGAHPEVPGEVQGRWLVETEEDVHGPFDYVVNAL